MSSAPSQPKSSLALVDPAGEAEGAPKSPPAFTVDMRYLVRALVKYNASDLHLKVGRPPLFRINGRLIPAKMPEFDAAQLESIIFSVLTSRQRADLEERKQLDLSFVATDIGRFRCHVYYQRNNLSAAIRMIPLNIPTLDDLGVPAVIKELCQRPRGLILITGSTGSGKSTTLASMVQHINQTSAVHVLCLEDPIEFLHRDQKATVTQREVGTDTHSLRDGLRAGLRQDPDVIVIGELRDYEMIELALSAAESGHLVLTTLHTNDARATIDRLLDVFPPEGKNQARIQLSAALVAVISQQLVVRADRSGRVLAAEVMVKSPIIENYILKNEIEKIPEAIANSNNYYKMQTMNQALERLVRSGLITGEEALKASSNHTDLKLALSGFVREEGYQMAGKFFEKGKQYEPPPLNTDDEGEKSA